MISKLRISFKRFSQIITEFIENSIKVKKGNDLVGYIVYDHKSQHPLMILEDPEKCYQSTRSVEKSVVSDQNREEQSYPAFEKKDQP